MKIPKNIKESINKSAEYRAIANEENEKIRGWIEENGLESKLGLMNILIDSIEIGNAPSELINYIEKEE